MQEKEIAGLLYSLLDLVLLFFTLLPLKGLLGKFSCGGIRGLG